VNQLPLICRLCGARKQDSETTLDAIAARGRMIECSCGGEMVWDVLQDAQSYVEEDTPPGKTLAEVFAEEEEE
jgi:hypothetical protein